jgi:hypothetical protein
VIAPAGQHLVVPHEVRPDGADVWVGLADAPGDGLRLAVGSKAVGVPPSWQRFAAGGHSLLSQRVTVSGLSPRQAYPVRLLRGSQVLADGTLTTLPAALPTPADRAFTVLLGSCFCVAQDPGGIAGAAVRQLPAQARPDVTILCGDQVYLDSPGLHFLACTHGRDELAAELLAHYLATWGQRSPGGGFSRILSTSATYFSSDDHEYWNNAPGPTPYVRDSWTLGGRQMWLDLARQLYTQFQAPAPGQAIAVGQLSIFVADTRLARTADGASFMTGNQLTALAAWIGRLSGPGVLVVGQPLFVAETGWRGTLTDRGLADYRQYHELVTILAQTAHDLIVLTGDVHFGRVATCTLPNGRRITELISSPLALVDPIATGKWARAPETLPAAVRPGGPRFPVTTDAYQRSDEHFVTLAFTGVGPSVRLAATGWLIEAGRAPVGRVVHTGDYH